ncbi:hypothetical protein [Planctomyces sp. SH-PL62]|uniref:hypothetical protein n=1 Tax=Planctomyces sp. SH-PL62 TaxID=1636152 RepID=UPI00078CA385|nr:hypothetical protein [Planctomyces sp. SH-PL62]AMV36290.1 hypothetical protein VT85_02520 [Planctomyces sp. SH-PL62]
MGETPGASTAAEPSPTPAVASEEEPLLWPSWARRAATVALVVHIAAVAGGALGVPPSSLLERRFADLFTWHHGLFDQGYAYRYYAEPPPTPIVVATLHRADGGPDVTVRIPEREVAGPPMRRQRQLALANALFGSSRAMHRDHGHEGGDEASWLARSYARHLGRTHPGTSSVTLRLQQHLIPSPDRVLDAMEETGGRFDLFDESLFTTPRWIGDFPCDGS